MNGLIKQLFKLNSPLAQLSEHNTEYQTGREGPAGVGSNPWSFGKMFTPNSPAAQLTEHKTTDLRRTRWSGLNARGFAKKKMS